MRKDIYFLRLKKIFIFLFLISGFGIFYFSTITNVIKSDLTILANISIIDKLAHILVYALWPLFIYFFYEKKVYLIATVCFVFSIAVEILQIFIERNFNFLDIISNFIGIVIGIIIFKTICKKMKIFIKKIISYFINFIFPSHVRGFLIQIDKFKFVCPIQDMEITRQLLFQKGYENKEILIIQNLVNQDSEIIFLGAHIGVHVVRIADKVKKIHAVEANPYIYDLLKINCQLNNLKNVELYNFAIGERDAKIQLLVNSVNTGGSKREPIVKKKMYYDKDTKLIQIPLKKGDNIFEKISEIDLMVMDIEGSEYFALLGMKKTLQKTITLIIEFIPHHLKNVSSTSINEYIELITQYFNYLYIPSQKIYLDNYEQIKKTIEDMYYNNTNDNGIIFSKKKIKYKDFT